MRQMVTVPASQSRIAGIREKKLETRSRAIFVTAVMPRKVAPGEPRQKLPVDASSI